MKTFPKPFAHISTAIRSAGYGILLSLATLLPIKGGFEHEGAASRGSDCLLVRTEFACATLDSYATSGESLAASSIAEHLDHLGVAAWHKAGDRGRGLKVLVL